MIFKIPGILASSLCILCNLGCYSQAGDREGLSGFRVPIPPLVPFFVLTDGVREYPAEPPFCVFTDAISEAISEAGEDPAEPPFCVFTDAISEAISEAGEDPAEPSTTPIQGNIITILQTGILVSSLYLDVSREFHSQESQPMKGKGRLFLRLLRIDTAHLGANRRSRSR